MSRSIPQYQREGWRPAGPYHCRCPHCGATVMTNALARAAHKRAHYAENREAIRSFRAIGCGSCKATGIHHVWKDGLLVPTGEVCPQCHGAQVVQ